MELQDTVIENNIKLEIEEPIKSKDEIMAEYIAEAQKKADAEYSMIVERAYNEGVKAAEVEAENIIPIF